MVFSMYKVALLYTTSIQLELPQHPIKFYLDQSRSVRDKDPKNFPLTFSQAQDNWKHNAMALIIGFYKPGARIMTR